MHSVRTDHCRSSAQFPSCSRCSKPEAVARRTAGFRHSPELQGSVHRPRCVFLPVKGQPGAPPESPGGAALSLNTLSAVRRFSAGLPSCDAAAATSQSSSVRSPSAVPEVSKPLPPHCSPVPGPTGPTPASGLVSPLGSGVSLNSAGPASKALACLLP